MLVLGWGLIGLGVLLILLSGLLMPYEPSNNNRSTVFVALTVILIGTVLLGIQVREHAKQNPDEGGIEVQR